MLFRLRPLTFFAAFALGLLLTYLMTPAPRLVVKFPSPYNAGHVTYKDDADACFKFNAQRVPCQSNSEGLLPQPILEDAPSS